MYMYTHTYLDIMLIYIILINILNVVKIVKSLLDRVYIWK